MFDTESTGSLLRDIDKRASLAAYKYLHCGATKNTVLREMIWFASGFESVFANRFSHHVNTGWADNSKVNIDFIFGWHSDKRLLPLHGIYQCFITRDDLAFIANRQRRNDSWVKPHVTFSDQETILCWRTEPQLLVACGE